MAVTSIGAVAAVAAVAAHTSGTGGAVVESLGEGLPARATGPAVAAVATARTVPAGTAAVSRKLPGRPGLAVAADAAGAALAADSAGTTVAFDVSAIAADPAHTAITGIAGPKTLRARGSAG